MSRCRKQYLTRVSAKRYAGLIASPASGQFVLPAGARFVIRPLIDVLAGTLCLEIESATSRDYHTNRDLLAGEDQVIDYLHKSSSVTVAANFELFVVTGLDKSAKVAEA